MEATPQRPIAEPPHTDAACLAALVERWSDAGAAVPVAIVVSVFDDVLPAVAEDGNAGLDAIIVDGDGVACLNKPVGLAAASQLLLRALGDDVPSAARPLVTRLTEDEDGPIDGEQLRQWMRDALGAPASREEVRAAFAALDDSEADTLLPSPVVVHEDEPVNGSSIDSEADLATLPPAVSSELPVPDLVSESDDELRPIAGEAPLPPERPHDTMIDGAPSFAVEASPAAKEAERVAAEGEARPSSVPDDLASVVEAAGIVEPTEADAATEQASFDAPPDPSTIVQPQPETPNADPGSDPAGRPIVRHTYNPKTVSLQTAPAARRSARAAAIGPDSILVPNERRGGYGWLFVFAAIGAVIYFLFFR